MVTEGFPKINQPWIDNYLEQILNFNFELVIFSNNMYPDNYNSKVDALQLRNFIIHLDLSKISLLQRVMNNLLAHPKKLIKVGFKAYKIKKHLQKYYKSKNCNN